MMHGKKTSFEKLYDQEQFLSQEAARGRADSKFLPDELRQRCEHVARFSGLSSEDQISFLNFVFRTLQTNRQLFSQIFPDLTPAQLENKLKAEQAIGQLNLPEELQALNRSIANAAKGGKISKDELRTVQGIKRYLGDLLVPYIQKQTSEQRHKDRIQVETTGRRADQLIDASDRIMSFEEKLHALERQIENDVKPQTVTVTIAYVDERNDYQSYERLTQVSLDPQDQTNPFQKTSRNYQDFPAQIFQLATTEGTFEEGKTTFVPLEINGRLVGIMTITVAPEEDKLSELNKQKAVRASEQIDTWLNGQLKERRLDRHMSRINRIIDRAGIQNKETTEGEKTGFEQGIREALIYLCKVSGAETIELKNFDVKGDGTYMINLRVTENSLVEEALGTATGVTPKMDSNPPPTVQSPPMSIPPISGNSWAPVSKLPRVKTPQTQIIKPLTIPQGLLIDNTSQTAQNGELIFRGLHLDDEDNRIAKLMSEKLISSALRWRTALGFAGKYRAPEHVLQLLLEGRLIEQSEEEVSTFIVDVQGYTRLSDRMNAVAEKYQKKRKRNHPEGAYFSEKNTEVRKRKILEIAAAYRNYCMEKLATVNGCYDNFMGDAVMAHFGPPFARDSQNPEKIRDSYGLDRPQQDPMNYAVNAVKATLRIEEGFEQTIQEELEDILYEMACETEKFKPISREGKIQRENKNPEEIRRLILERFYEEELGYKPHLKTTKGIGTAEVNIGFVMREIQKINAQPEQDIPYTTIGDGTNVTARIQHIADSGETMIDAATKEYLEQAWGNNSPIPFNAKGETQTMEEFKQEILGEKYTTHDLIPYYEPVSADLKNKGGAVLAYRLMWFKIPKVQPQTALEKAESTYQIVEDEAALKKLGDHIYILESSNNNGATTNYYVHSHFFPGQKQLLKISTLAQEDRYISDEEFDRRFETDDEEGLNEDDQIMVVNGKIKHVKYHPYSEKLDEKIDQLLSNKKAIYQLGDLEHAIYRVNKTTSAVELKENLDQLEQTLLAEQTRETSKNPKRVQQLEDQIAKMKDAIDLVKDGMIVQIEHYHYDETGQTMNQKKSIFSVLIPTADLPPFIDATQDKEIARYFKKHVYPWQKRAENPLLMNDLTPQTQYLFVHTSGAYLDKLSG